MRALSDTGHPRGPGRRRGADQRTRRRLLGAASALFAERAFDEVTVRELCRAARANVAAVNYHFGDKFGLYAAVVELAIATMRAGREEDERREGPAEARLREYVRTFLERLSDRGAHSWIHRLIHREIENPTPALDRLVERAIRPRLDYLGALVAEMMGCPPHDARVQRVVASIQGQCLVYTHTSLLSRLLPRWRPTPAALAEVAEHIAAFSAAGMRALRAGRPSPQGGA